MVLQKKLFFQNWFNYVKNCYALFSQYQITNLLCEVIMIYTVIANKMLAQIIKPKRCSFNYPHIFVERLFLDSIFHTEFISGVKMLKFQNQYIFDNSDKY